MSNCLTNMYHISNPFVCVVNRKYEEITPPHVEELCYITDNTYTKEEVRSLFLFLVLDKCFPFLPWVCNVVLYINTSCDSKGVQNGG